MEQFRWGREQGLLMVRTKRMGCREKENLHHGNPGGCKARMEDWSWRLRQKRFEGADADVGTSGEKNAEGLHSRYSVKVPQDVGCLFLSRKDEQRAGAPGELGKLQEQGELRERWRASDGEGQKSISESAEWMCGGDGRSRSTLL